MSEYAARRPSPRIEDIDNTGTLFDTNELDSAVDIHNISYSEARNLLGIAQESITPKNGIAVSLADRYVDELQLLDLTSASSMREGFSKALELPDVTTRYGEDLPRVAEGANRNIRINNQMIRALYHTPELLSVGFDSQDIEDDVALMRMEYRREYAGPENALKRAARRRFLRTKLAKFGIDHTK